LFKVLMRSSVAVGFRIERIPSACQTSFGRFHPVGTDRDITGFGGTVAADSD
jgi:hypothetical protein